MSTEQAPARKDSHPAIEAIKRHWAVKVLLVILPAVVSSIAAYSGASDDAEVQAKVVKDQAERVEDKAESGYQVAVGELERLRAAVARLEGEVSALKRTVRAIGRKPSVSVAVSPAAPSMAAPAAPAPLPATLDKALEQQPPEVVKP